MLEKEDILAKIKRNNIKQQVLAAAHCANACRHLLKDERSLRALEDALRSNPHLFSEIVINAAYANHAATAADNAAIAAEAAADHAANAIYSAAKALKDDEVIESIIDKYLPL